MKGHRKANAVSREELTSQQLEENLRYYSSSGEFQWRNTKDIYDTCGDTITLLGTRYKAEDLAWFYMYGQWPDGTLIHKDGDVHNNAIDNLAEE